MTDQLIESAKILIVDDHKLIVDGLNSLLAEVNGLSVEGLFTNPEMALGKIKSSDIDLLITDVNMPGIDGFQLIQEAKKSKPSLKCIMVSMYNNEETIAKAKKLNANGYLLKNVGKTELIKAIKEVLDGNNYFVLEHSSFQKLEEPKDTIDVELSKRESDILQMISEELTTNEIAEKLFLSPNTIETYRRRLFIKLEVKNVAGLVKKGIKYNLIS